MRALTVRQPWASAIAHADKRTENRVWPTSYRGPVLIHSARTIDRAANRHAPMSAIVRGLQLDLGAVLAVARLVDCHDGTDERTPCTPWAMKGHHHLVLDDVTALPLPVPWQGRLQLWVPPAELVARVRLQLDDETAARLLDGEGS
ncbi:hypothetical protein ACFQ7A_04980 [Streptomyces sp. NPDC056528]|uniref:hypothetical protein n=1 Tax=Streptomyces sp. NPDC056528 TaxID=3345854 RepID=UPI00368BC213